MFVVELVEIKAHLLKDVPLEFEDLYGKTVGLLLHMMKIYFATSRYVIIDIGLFVLNGFTRLRKTNIFSCAIIKKRSYWLYMVQGKYMDYYYGDLEVWETNAVQVTVDEVIYIFGG